MPQRGNEAQSPFKLLVSMCYRKYSDLFFFAPNLRHPVLRGRLLSGRQPTRVLERILGLEPSAERWQRAVITRLLYPHIRLIILCDPSFAGTNLPRPRVGGVSGLLARQPERNVMRGLGPISYSPAGMGSTQCRSRCSRVNLSGEPTLSKLEPQQGFPPTRALEVRTGFEPV